MPKDMNAGAFTDLKARFNAVRSRTEALAAVFTAEDLCVQTMPDVSPGKWHLAHVTWFWETFLLKPGQAGYTPFDPRFNYLFNSYYEAVGERHARPERGFLTRPGLNEVLAYRAHVDRAVSAWFDQADAEAVQAFRLLRILAESIYVTLLGISDFLSRQLRHRFYLFGAYCHGDTAVVCALA